MSALQQVWLMKSPAGTVILGAVGSILAWLLITLLGRLFGSWIPFALNRLREMRRAQGYKEGYTVGVLTETAPAALAGYFAYHLSVMLSAICGLILSCTIYLASILPSRLPYSERHTTGGFAIACMGGFLLYAWEHLTIIRAYYRHEIMPHHKAAEEVRKENEAPGSEQESASSD